MIDFIKAEIINFDAHKLKSNSRLEFRTQMNYTTGELGSHSYAFYNGLKFKIYHRTKHSKRERVFVEGSIHKFFNNGLHNYNAFNRSNVDKVFKDLRLDFGIKPKHLRMMQMEIGVNFIPPINSKQILSYCLLHSTKLFKWTATNPDGNYLQAEHYDYFIKIYDKRKQYDRRKEESIQHFIPHEILRFEIKAKGPKLKTMFGNRRTLTMQHILDHGINKFSALLLKEWNRILFYDQPLLQYSANAAKYSNAMFWANLKPDNLKYHRKQMLTAEQNCNGGLRKKIGHLIYQTMNNLINNTPEYQPSSIGLNWVA